MKKILICLVAILAFTLVAFAGQAKLDPNKGVTLTPAGGVRAPYAGTNVLVGPPQRWNFGGIVVNQVPESNGEGFVDGLFKSDPAEGTAYPYWQYRFLTDGTYKLLKVLGPPNDPPWTVWETGTWTQP